MGSSEPQGDLEPFRTKGSHRFHSPRLIPALLVPSGSPLSPPPSLCRPNVSRHPPRATRQPLPLKRARLAWGKVGGHLRAPLLPLFLLFLPGGPPVASSLVQVAKLGEPNRAERRTPGHPLLSPSPFCSQGPRGPSSARAAPLPRAWRSETLCAGQPEALAAIQGGERRGKQRAGEGRGGEPRAQEQRRAPHRTAPRTLAGSRDARAAAWAHQPGHLVPEVSPERRSGAGRSGAAGVGGGNGERAAGAGGCPRLRRADASQLADQAAVCRPAVSPVGSR